MADLFSCFDDEGSDHEQAVEDNKTSRQSATPSVSQTGQKSSKREHENEEELTKRMKLESIEDVMEELNLGDLDNRITIHTIETIEACMHEVAVPPNCEYQTLKRSTDAPVRTYSFILDPFQKEAILCIDNNQSVLVSAHTSAGKTVVAEYAVAQSLKNKQRVIYTTPIKALSNQKYREFLEEFSDVGLITGDVTINPSASCLIMTTEILRNMLYRGSELLREVGWVVFDEIHYMRDKERGVVWEETLILLPDSVRNVFLSATIPNARQFAEWVCHIHKQPCHVVYTDYRPTPLQHYIFPDGGDGIHLVVDVQGQFKENNFNTAMNVLQGDSTESELGGTKIAKKSSMKRNAAQSNVFNVVKMIIERNFSPVIAFSFSKKDCELYAMQMSKLDFNTAEEKKLVDEVFNNAMDVLSDDDKHLPQVDNVLPHLRRGIGIHHGGLLPILKETIEILFSEGLIKVLFATETFAMGLNMPARTVLFTGMRKFDGKDYRWLTSGEYIQMSGRAGRRGLDDKGIVILMVDEKVSPATGREIIQGKPDPINSSFHLTYNMVLNLLRVEEINPEYMMERSFFQFQNHSSIPDLYDKYKTKWDEYQSLKIQNESNVKSYHQIKLTFQQLQEKSLTYILEPMKLLPFLQPGRLIKVKYNEYDYDWGAIINFKKTTQKPRGPKSDQKKNTDIETKLVISIMLHVSEEFTNNVDSIPLPCPPGQEGKLEVVPCNSSLITEISSVRVRLPDDVRPLDNRKSVKRAIDQAKIHFKGKLPILEAEKDMGITDKEFKRIKKQMDVLQERIKSHPLHSDPKRDEMYSKYERKLKCKNELDAAKKELKKAKSLLQMDELKNRKRVLRRLGFCDEQDVISTKGRIACEISGADELLLTEMIFCGMLDNLSAPQCVALLSCFVFDEKSTSNPKLAEELSGPLRKMQDIARRIAKVSVDCKLELDESKYVESFKPFLMDIVFAWCNGALFLELCQMTDIFEGSIIRCMRRLEELLRQLLQVSKTIGNKILEEKVTEGIKLIKRDIVFAASLYL